MRVHILPIVKLNLKLLIEVSHVGIFVYTANTAKLKYLPNISVLH